MLFRGGNRALAKKQLQILVSTYPKNWRIKVSLAEVLRQMHEGSAALLIAEKLCQVTEQVSCYALRGLLRLDSHDLDGAQADFLKALQLDPMHGDSLGNLLSCLRQQGKYDEGKRLAQSHASLISSRSELLNNLGALYFSNSDFQEALKLFLEAYDKDKHYLMAQMNIVKTYLALNNLKDALLFLVDKIDLNITEDDFLLAVLQKCENINPDFEFARLVSSICNIENKPRIATLLIAGRGPIWHLKAARHYLLSGQANMAKEMYIALEAVAPNDVAVLNNYGSFLFSLHFYSEAKSYFEKLSLIQPNNYLIWRNLGVCSAILGNKDEAYHHYKLATQLNPNDQPSLVFSLDSQLHLAIWDEFEKDRDHLEQLMKNAGEDLAGSLQLLSLTESAKTQLDYISKANAVFFKEMPDIGIAAKRRCILRHDRIKVAYLSFDFRDHPVSYLTAELFELHDRSQFEVHVFSYGPAQDSMGYRKRISEAADLFYDLKDNSLTEMAKIIHKADLDVLIDLTANTQHTRSHILGYRLAPIQMHWLGYMATMGSEHYDYVITDPVTSPLGYDCYFKEKLIRLPDTLQINDRKRILPSKQAHRSEMGLPSEGTIFCNFAQSFKIQPKIFSSWMRILNGVPGSVLWMAVSHSTVQKRLCEYAEEAGVDSNRLIFAPRVALEEHLVRYSVADLLLDTYPIGSGTTASESIWMGCPLLVYAGELMYSRMAAGILHAANLDSFICQSISEYESRAIELGNSPNILRETKVNLLKNRSSLPLFDSPKFVRNFELALCEAVNQSRNFGELTAITIGTST